MRPTRTADDLVGKRVIVPETFLITPAMRKRPKWNTLARWNRHIQCKVVKVKTNKEGRLIAIYVVKPKETRYVNGKFVIKKWMKSPKRLLPNSWEIPIRRYRWEDESKFRWVRCLRGDEPPRRSSVDRVHPKGSSPTIGHWLNNPSVCEQVILRRYDEHRYGDPRFGSNPNSSNFKPPQHWKQWDKVISDGPAPNS